MARVHSEWGLHGVELFRDRCAVLIIVDVLSFSTAVDVAVGRGASIYPFAFGDEQAARAEAERLGVRLAGSRASGAQLSLSPTSIATLTAGEQLLLPSPNGSRLSLACGSAIVMAGCLRNAAAVASAALALAGGGDIAVIPAGERWADGGLRPAIEDLIGAGAVIDALGLAVSPEAQVARNAYQAGRRDLAEMIGGSLSGRELIDRGFGDDVEIASQVGVSACAPVLRDGAYSN